MLLSTTHLGNGTIEKLPKLPQCFQIVWEQIAPRRRVFFHNNRAVVNPVTDPVPGYIQFFLANCGIVK
jgi:hypothetical protein